MSLLQLEDGEAIGGVFSVDTSSLVIAVTDIDQLRRLQVNQLVAVRSSRHGQHLIGLINKITRRSISSNADTSAQLGEANNEVVSISENFVRVSLIGTFKDVEGLSSNVFKRTLDTVPEIDALCFKLDSDNLTSFMRAIASQRADNDSPLTLGRYSMDENAEAFIDGNKFFQRHAVVVGSTGSGKSWSVAKLLEQISELPSANCIQFDIHGEYHTIKHEKVQHFVIAGPSERHTKESLQEGKVFLPYWLLSYEEMLAILLDRSDSNAPNQAMLFSKVVSEEKRKYLEENNLKDLIDNFTIDSPIPYNLQEVLQELKNKDAEMVPSSSGKEKQGPFFGRLTRFIQRLEAKINDKRLNFLFNVEGSGMSQNWLSDFCSKLLKSSSDGDKKGVKIVDFSEVPSDILPLMIGLVGHIIFSLQQWTSREDRHPIALFCDEAHLYIPERTSGNSVSELSLKSFERIAKEGRKYGVGLVVISQRPSEVNRTVLSQCNNFISLRLTNAEDQIVVKRLLPDNLGGVADVLPILDIGEALVVGDASLLPTRIIIDEPMFKPASTTIPFWMKWSLKETNQNVENAVMNYQKQTRT